MENSSSSSALYTWMLGMTEDFILYSKHHGKSEDIALPLLAYSSSYCLRKQSPTGKKSQQRRWYSCQTYDSW